MPPQIISIFVNKLGLSVPLSTALQLELARMRDVTPSNFETKAFEKSLDFLRGEMIEILDPLLKTQGLNLSPGNFISTVDAILGEKCNNLVQVRQVLESLQQESIESVYFTPALNAALSLL